MRVLVIGANGLLGSNVIADARERGLDIVGTYHASQPAFDVPMDELDVRDTAAFVDVLTRYRPDAVINCAAMTDVDSCERRPEKAHEINSEAPGTLAACCDDRDVRFVHLSTDYVFDGDGTEPYSETDETNPIQVYGRTKREGERKVSAASRTSLVIRPSFLYGIHRSTDELSGFPAWVRERLEAKERTALFTDQQITPTRAGQGAETILDLLLAGADGLYHVACRSCVTPYEFGAEIHDRMDVSEELLVEDSKADLDRPAPRPSDTCLDVSKVETALSRPQPTIATELDEIESTLCEA